MSDFFFFLPEALMLNIWLNLAIKSSVRFRCVSKSWCASLSDPHFIYKNLIFPDAAASEHDLLLLVNKESPHHSVVSHETLMATPIQVPPEVPIPDESFDTHILTTPLDDLVCFYHYFEFYVGVWNLTTGETRVYADDFPLHHFITLGFGFDEKTNVYKIVKILCPGINHFVAYVYSLTSGSNNCWRKVGEPNFLYVKDYGALSVYSRSYRDGTFYWGCAQLIASFDMSTEVFNFISIPSGPYSSIQEICKLKEGSMLIITWCTADCEKWTREYEIWVLLELGVTQSWTKLLAIDWCCEDDTPLGLWRHELVIKSSSNGRLLITKPFELETKEVQIDEPHDISRCLAWTKGKKTFTNIVYVHGVWACIFRVNIVPPPPPYKVDDTTAIGDVKNISA